MTRKSLRIRVSSDGALEIVDPGFDALPLLREVDRYFAVRSAPLPCFTNPRFMRSRAIATPIRTEDAKRMTLEDLRAVHRRSMDQLGSDKRVCAAPRSGELSALHLKALIARRMLEKCSLCARQCGVNRIAGEVGPCGLGHRAYVAEHFVHIAEEAPINPSLLLSLRGCGLRCRYCQQHELLNASGTPSEELTKELWGRLESTGARSMSFIGGNPDESLPSILEFLTHAPEAFSLPIVWNHHAYATEEAIDLLEHVVDVFVPDLKYGSDECALRLSGVKDYCATVQESLRRQLAQRVPVIVRVLVLPGHDQCCHRPALEYLASLPQRDLLEVSIRGQYAPDWKISSADGPLAFRSTKAEWRAMHEYAIRLGLKVIDAKRPA